MFDLSNMLFIFDTCMICITYIYIYMYNIYMYIYTCICLYFHTHTIDTRTHVCIYIYIYLCIQYTDTQTHMFEYQNIYYAHPLLLRVWVFGQLGKNSNPQEHIQPIFLKRSLWIGAISFVQQMWRVEEIDLL